MIKTLEEFNVYQLAMDLGDTIWNHVIKWDWITKDTIGKQLIKSADSIAANLSEGLGRYHYNETKQFSYYSRGSLFETKTWLTKARNRNLIDEPEFKKYMEDLEIIGLKINNYINSIGKKTINTPIP